MGSQCQAGTYVGTRCMNTTDEGIYCYAHRTTTQRNMGALPLGELHDKGRCARCGQRGTAGVDLQRTVLISTHAVAMVCKETHACLRRRTDKKKGRV